MSTQKKGPDPLNRLFDPPPSPGLMPLPPVESGEDTTVIDPADIDAVMSEARRAHPPTPTLSPVEDAAPASPAAPAVDPRELAKMLAKAAAAKARAQAEAAPPPAPVAPPASPPSWTPMQSGRPPGSRLANLPLPSAALPPVAPEVKAAPAPAPAPAPVAPAPVAPEAKTSRLAAMPMPVKPKTSSEVLEAGSRLAALAPPPARKKSAAEVLEEMSRNPQPVAAKPVAPPAAPVAPPAAPVAAPAVAPAAPAATSPAAALAAALLQSTFPASGGFQIVNQLAVEDREVQKALWRGHRARFFATGAVEHAIAASSVIAALGRPGTLVVAKVAAGSRDWLVWVDGQQGCCIAAFPDAGVWFTGI